MLHAALINPSTNERIIRPFPAYRRTGLPKGFIFAGYGSTRSEAIDIATEELKEREDKNALA